MIRAAAFYVLVEAMFVVFIGALRGAGDTLWAMFISVSLHWVLFPVLYVMLRVMKMSPEAGWMALVVVFMVFSMFVYWRYRTGHWRNIKVVYREKESEAITVSDFHVKADL